jgi:predicted nucleotidyltransferase
MASIPAEHALVRDIATLLRRHPAVAVGILFGSLARGQGGPGSDLDLAVAGQRPLDAADRQALIEDVAGITGYPVDLVDLQTAGLPILAEALGKGRLVYNRDPSLYAELIKRMLFDQADFEPLRRRIHAERRRAWSGA